MFAYSIFSHSQASASARAFSAFSLFGYLELKAPTLAERATRRYPRPMMRPDPPLTTASLAATWARRSGVTRVP